MVLKVLVKWVKEQQDVLLTDTTFRDAHQSLLATRVRSHDMFGIAEESAQWICIIYSLMKCGEAQHLMLLTVS